MTLYILEVRAKRKGAKWRPGGSIYVNRRKAGWDAKSAVFKPPKITK